MPLEQDELIALRDRLRISADYWREIKEDPHNVGNAVMICLLEVITALNEIIEKRGQ